jgi:hypothetical protein
MHVNGKNFSKKLCMITINLIRVINNIHLDEQWKKKMLKKRK